MKVPVSRFGRVVVEKCIWTARWASRARTFAAFAALTLLLATASSPASAQASNGADGANGAPTSARRSDSSDIDLEERLKWGLDQ